MTDSASRDISLDDTQRVRLPVKSALMTHADRVKLFGAFRFTHAPVVGNPEHIAIAEPWERERIVRVTLPANAHMASRAVRVHKKVAPQFEALWKAWQAAGLLDLVLTFDGAWAPRFKRQTGTYDERVAKCQKLGQYALSNHAFGSAFDICARWNRLGKPPAVLGAEGCVRELVPLAQQFGFAWGGDWKTPDGMHFEVSRLL